MRLNRLSPLDSNLNVHRSLFSKKLRKLPDIEANISKIQAASEPVTPMRPKVSHQVKSSRHTIDYFVEAGSRQRNLQEVRGTLPSIRTTAFSKRKIEPLKCKLRNKNNPESTGERGLLPTQLPFYQWCRALGESPYPEQVQTLIEKEDSKTVEYQLQKMSSIRIKPLILQNKLTGKFVQPRKPSSQQLRSFKSRMMDTEMHLNGEFFTFYPRHHQSNKTEGTNEFLDIG